MNTETKLTGAELIAIERREQIEKHGYTLQEDKSRYDEDFTGNYAEPSDLVIAAIASIQTNLHAFPHSWNDSPFVDKIKSKPYKERLIIAGALIAAEIDRVNSKP